MRLKKYMFTILLVLFMFTTFIVGLVRFTHWKDNSINETLAEIEKCENLQEDYKSESHKEYCEKLFYYNKDELKLAYFDVMTYVEDFIPLSSNFILIFFMVISSCHYITKYLRNNIIANDVQREKYNTIKLKLLVSSWMPALAITCVIIIRMIVYYYLTNNFNYNVGTTIWQSESLENISLFFISYILVTLFDLLIYANVCLIVARKKHNFLLCTILSYLVIIGIELFLEIFINIVICTNILHLDIGIVFNIINFGYYNDSYGIFIPIIISFVIFVITFIITNILYQNKESLIIDCESYD